MEIVVILLILALVAALFGFGGIASTFTGFALILFWIFLILFVIGLVFRAATGDWVGHHAHHDDHHDVHHDDDDDL
jgi:uncharacterized membrane protein YtjA (UPF0391 family)